MGIQDKKLLNQMVYKIVQKHDPRKIVLFGSRARKSAKGDSDYDLLIIADSKEPRYRRSAPYFPLLADLPVEVDIMVYTPEEVRDWKMVPQSFVSVALREGRVLYEKTC